MKIPEVFLLSGLPLTRIRKRPLPARFIERPNRFTARVLLPDGGESPAHLPNPGRLTGTLIAGCTVLLDGPFPPPRALPYTVVAAREPAVLVGTVTTYANRVFAELWRGSAFPELRGRALVAEIIHGNNRFDFRAGRTFVEVKSVTLAEGRTALFPDAVTGRGAKHCRELARLARRGTPAAIVFVAQRDDVDWIAPADLTDPEFAAALRHAARSGARLLGCALEITPLVI